MNFRSATLPTHTFTIWMKSRFSSRCNLRRRVRGILSRRSLLCTIFGGAISWLPSACFPCSTSNACVHLSFFSNSCKLCTHTPPKMQVPNEWQEDRRWRQAGGAGLRDGPAHKAKVPSRWIPLPSALQRPDPDKMDSEGSHIRIIDKFTVSKKRPNP